MKRGEVLVVDDEPVVREILGAYLQREGYRVREAADGDIAERALGERLPDILILDVMLPGRSGLDLLRDVRRSSHLPVLLLSARTAESDRIVGLELGADDYVVKPFSPREVVARVNAMARRLANRALADAAVVIKSGPLVIDPGTREVVLGTVLVRLTAKEYDLLELLAAHPRQVFSRAQLLDRVWASNDEWQNPATVTVHVGRVRQKLRAVDPEWEYISTVHGIGYRFEPLT
jgi:DNA-binding response OmpR family regulator